MIDVHNHLHDPRFGDRQDELIATMKDQGITACVVNGTCPDDWPEVARLAEKHPDFVRPAFGLHPWKVSQASADWVQTLTALLNDHPQASLGECGLDQWMESPDLHAQLEAFRAQLHLAHDLDRPITVHCLQAWGPLLEELQALDECPRFLLHSYGGSIEFARQCQELGAYFSFSGYFLGDNKQKTREVFSRLPGDRILVESDAPEMLPPSPPFTFESHNHPANLPHIAEKLGEICELSPECFTENARRFFGIESE